jgi:hypothetical protein
MILMGCLWIVSITGLAQSTNGREKSGTPLRWRMNGSTEVLEGEMYRNYNSTDTLKAKKTNLNTSAVVGHNPSATRFTSVQALCEFNSIRFNWTAAQQYSNADHYDIEQTSDEGINWQPIGTIPANRSDIGEAAYSFIYNKNLGKVLFRVTAVNIAGEKTYSSLIQSPCTNTTYLSVTPNPVVSNASIKIGAPSATQVKMTLVNTSGIVVQTKELKLLQGNNQLSLDMSSLQKGNYILSIFWDGGNSDTFKLVKQ